ncbi:MAG: AMP-dependent synthetase [Lautropia sp.]|nr:MAG: AMP-dependent synthetase [Pseudomonadota bacterium]MBC6959057.1 AMP-dependent synthetase [Lautropia sp.]
MLRSEQHACEETEVPTIVELLGASSRQPDTPALLAPNRRSATHADLSGQLRRVASALRSAGVRHRARVAVCVPNGPEAATATLSVAASATCVPLNPAYQTAEFRYYLEDARVDAVIVPEAEHGLIRDVTTELGLTVFEMVVDLAAAAGCFELRAARSAMRPAGTAQVAAAEGSPAPDDVALILHTSGTTARPKIVPLSHANLTASARSFAAHPALLPDDRCLNVMPLFHIHGLVGALLAPLASGGSNVCTPGFDEQAFFGWVADFGPTWYTAMPTIHQAIVAHGDAYRRIAPQHRFRFVRSSSSALPPTTLAALESLLEAPVLEAYGMTETSHQMATNPLPPRPRKPGSVGLPASVEVAILDDAGREMPQGAIGEIAIRGPSVTAGHERYPEANANAFTRGWFRTGDQVRMDADDYIFISGRLKEIVNRGGEKVSPREVDEALLEHPDVAQAVAFAMPQPSLGEGLAAAVVPKRGSHPEEAGLRGFLLSSLAGFKVPSRIVFVDAIPKRPTGKVPRTSLHEKLAHALAPAFVAPHTHTERTVESVLREVLEGAPLGVHAHFFAAGGDSLRGAQVIARLNERLSLELPVTALFQPPTVAELARAIDEAPESEHRTRGIAGCTDRRHVQRGSRAPAGRMRGHGLASRRGGTHWMRP